MRPRGKERRNCCLRLSPFFHTYREKWHAYSFRKKTLALLKIRQRYFDEKKSNVYEKLYSCISGRAKRTLSKSFVDVLVNTVLQVFIPACINDGDYCASFSPFGREEGRREPNLGDRKSEKFFLRRQGEIVSISRTLDRVTNFYFFSFFSFGGERQKMSAQQEEKGGVHILPFLLAFPFFLSPRAIRPEYKEDRFFLPFPPPPPLSPIFVDCFCADK